MSPGGRTSYCAAALLLGAAFPYMALVAVQSEPVIPLDPNGHVMLRQGPPNATPKVEIYLDLACSDCALAWPTIREVADVYGHQAEFLYRLFPLPYHRNAFSAAKAAKTVRTVTDGDDAAVASFFTAVFDGQDRILNAATEHMTQPEIEGILRKWATSTTGMSVEDFDRGMVDDDVEQQTRTQFKYGCLHGVSGTPQVYVGGVLVDDLDGESSFHDWQVVLAPLLGSTTATLSRPGGTYSLGPE